jgi:hypothetical protein
VGWGGLGEFGTGQGRRFLAAAHPPRTLAGEQARRVTRRTRNRVRSSSEFGTARKEALMNCLISDQPYLRAIETLLGDLSAPCETIILTSEVTATDLAYSVLHSAAAKVGEVTVISHRELGSDPAVDLLDRSLYRQSWVRCQSDAGHPVPFAGNIVLIHSQDEVRAAIGSAPLTDGRWGVNRDVWTVLRTRCGCAPIAMHDLADLLHTISSGGASLPDLDRQFELDPHSAFALHSLANEIRSREALDTDACLLTNLQRTIAEQLREHAPEPVQDLAVYAPAYHPELHGIDTLINVLKPTGTATIYTNGQRFDREHLTHRARADGTRRSVHSTSRRRHPRMRLRTRRSFSGAPRTAGRTR